MTRTIVLVTALLTLLSGPVYGNGGVFLIGGEVGSARHIGGVVQGAQIVLDIEARQTGLSLTCPMKVTLVFMADNNRTRLVKRMFRRNALDSQIVLSAPISGELVVFFQTQSFDHLCTFTFAAEAGTVPLARPLAQTPLTDDDDTQWDDIPPEPPLPVHPDAVKHTGLP